MPLGAVSHSNLHLITRLIVKEVATALNLDPLECNIPVILLHGAFQTANTLQLYQFLLLDLSHRFHHYPHRLRILNRFHQKFLEFVGMSAFSRCMMMIVQIAMNMLQHVLIP